MNQQLTEWAGTFGQAYTDRNVIDWRQRLPAFRHMLSGLPLERVLEVGCNRGHNLVALRACLGESVELVGIEPNPHALSLARSAVGSSTMIRAGHLSHVPFPDGHFDLVFTAGVLIHVPPDALETALDELYRCSGRYLLAIEYAAERDTAIPYRGREDLLWKRDFLQHYQVRFADLALRGTGVWGPADGFDNVTWWLLEKPSNPGT